MLLKFIWKGPVDDESAKVQVMMTWQWTANKITWTNDDPVHWHICVNSLQWIEGQEDLICYLDDCHLVNKIQCGAVITWLVFSKILTKYTP